ncbi:ROK family transcriptional regulator [Actinotalea subterranea]|uniref:ROK family transcriptional regulator n=1 Tax=Actinotalea subterranea TaxID=2607497 RepID=UPI0011EE0A95|nr:ROK family transcriptional regulator [Actinotalea subterranea]
MRQASRPTSSRGDLVPSAVLGLLGTRGPTSRADVARALGVSPATITQITKDLIARGLVTELETAKSQGGRPGRLLGLVHTAGGAIGVKVTADHLAIVDARLDGSVTSSSVRPFDPDAPDALDLLAREIGAAVTQHGGHLLGVGVGIPGSVDSQASGVVSAPTLGWSEARVGDVLRAALGVPVLVENDVNTLAVAEALYGAGREHSTYVVVTIGRGIGCGIIVDGSVFRGASGGAGEIGHIPVDPDGPLCRCGSRGCLEALVGEAALVRQGREAGVLDDAQGMRDLRAAADAGDDRAREVFARAGRLFGRTLAGLVHTVDPEIVVLLGEGIDAWPHWRRAFEESFRSHLMPSRRTVPVLTEPWADDRWALGAAALVLASPLDAEGVSGEQGDLVRARLHVAGGDAT